MTNGEKLKEVFPDIEFTDMAYTVHAVTGVTSNGVKGHISYDFWKEWWNAEYKEPTTKKCTTCAYREIDGKPHEMCKSCVCGDRYREDSTTKNDLAVEEAIEMLKKDKEQRGNCFISDALDMAIEALEKEPFINKPCVSEKVCEHDKNEVLDKIRAEIIAESFHEDGDLSYCTIVYLGDVLGIIDKYQKGGE